MKGHYTRMQRIKVDKESVNIFTVLWLILLLAGIIVIGFKWLSVFGIM